MQGIFFAAALFIFIAGEVSAATIVAGRNCSIIQAAINQLPPAGGEVIVKAGKYTCANHIVINRDNVTLRGEGSATLLRLASDANSPVIVMGQPIAVPTVTRRNIHVSNLAIDGNRANQQFECWHGPCSETNALRNNGITIRRCEDCSVEGVTAYSTASGGLVTELGCRRLTVRGYMSYDNFFDGVAGYETENSVFTGLNLYKNLGAGLSFDIQFNNNIISNSVLTENARVGIFMRDSKDNLFSGLQIRKNGEHGVFLAQVDADDTKPAKGNTFSGVIVSESNGDGIRVNNASCVDNSVVVSQFNGNAQECIYEGAPVVQAGNICR
jgi:parallel beta-helix repeat protein